MRTFTRFGIVCLCLGLVFAQGCKPHSVRTYNIPHEKIVTASTLAELNAKSPGVHWVVPAGGQVRSVSAPMKAAFDLVTPTGKAEITVVSFPGQTGDLLANLNRWRGQIQLPPIEEKDTEALVQTRRYMAFEMRRVAFQSAKEAMEIGFFMSGNDTWFFKLKGDVGVVYANKMVFESFLDSVYEN